MAIAYDAARQCVVLFGGVPGGGSYQGDLGDTWLWDGSNWAQAFPLNSPNTPKGFVWHSVAFDAARGQVILFGGQKLGYGDSNETWTWDGTNWTQQSPDASPPPRFLASMAYDGNHQTVVLFGGVASPTCAVCPQTYYNDTWVWNGTNWIDTIGDPASTPQPRDGAALVYDSNHAQMLLFGGLYAGNIFFNDTWIW
jgi:hypothetical protein